MESSLREAAIAHAPFFITAPGETDVLFVSVIWFVVLAVFLIGAFYLNIHALPERLAHHANHNQIQLIGVLTLLALFTHNNIFWVAALILAVIQFPNFITPVQSIAASLRSMAQGKTGDGKLTPDDSAGSKPEAAKPLESNPQEGPKDV
jgi:multisubunit Na+/H+ antiporter MnhF subunit